MIEITGVLAGLIKVPGGQESITKAANIADKYDISIPPVLKYEVIIT